MSLGLIGDSFKHVLCGQIQNIFDKVWYIYLENKALLNYALILNYL